MALAPSDSDGEQKKNQEKSKENSVAINIIIISVIITIGRNAKGLQPFEADAAVCLIIGWLVMRKAVVTAAIDGK